MSAILRISRLPHALMGVNDSREWAKFELRITAWPDRVMVNVVQRRDPEEEGDRVLDSVTVQVPPEDIHKSHYDVCPGCGLRDCDAEAYRQRQREHHRPEACSLGAAGHAVHHSPASVAPGAAGMGGRVLHPFEGFDKLCSLCERLPEQHPAGPFISTSPRCGICGGEHEGEQHNASSGATGPETPCAGGRCPDPAAHAEGAHDV